MDNENRIGDRASEAWDKVKGKTNEVVGAARGDRMQELKGKGQGIKGSLKEGINDLKHGDKDRRL